MLTNESSASGARALVIRWLTAAAQLLLWAYRGAVSPYLGPRCRFAPSCSDYAGQALRRYGLRRGTWMALRRLLRCHPFHPGGWDPVV